VPLPTAPAASAGLAQTVLVIDDEAMVRRVVGRVLVRRGYRVLEGANVDDALRVAAEHPIDLVLSDMILPGGDGHHLVAALRDLRPDAAVVFMSGHAPEAVAAAPFLRKPFAAEELLAAVRTALPLP